MLHEAPLVEICPILGVQYPGEEGEVLHGASLVEISPTCEQLVRERARYLVSSILVKRARCSTEPRWSAVRRMENPSCTPVLAIA